MKRLYLLLGLLLAPLAQAANVNVQKDTSTNTVTATLNLTAEGNAILESELDDAAALATRINNEVTGSGQFVRETTPTIASATLTGTGAAPTILTTSRSRLQLEDTNAIGTVAGAGTATLSANYKRNTATGTGSTATIALPTLSNSETGWWYLHWTSTYDGGAQTVTLPNGLIWTSNDIDTVTSSTTRSVPATTGGTVLFQFHATAGTWDLYEDTLPRTTLALTTGTLAQFAATTSAELAGVLSNETGSGLAVFATSPVFTTPNLGTPSAVTLTNGNGLPQAGTVGLTTADSPQFTAVNIGAATDTTIARVGAGQISVEGVNVVTTASADVLTNKTLDGSATGNVVKLFGYLVLTHPHVFGSGVTQQTTVTANTYGQALFGNATDKATNYVEYYFVVPPDVDTAVAWTGTFKVQLAAGDTGDQEYEISFDSVADSAAYAGTLGDAISLAYTADASGAANDVETAGETTLTGWAGAMTAAQLMVVRVARDGDHANDTSTQNTYSGPLVLKYGVTQ